ncbi:LysE family translocator [Roseobacter sp. A03A-229]
MIDWLIFIPACFALNLAFGPNNLLAMTNGARHGVLFAQRAAVGRLLMFVPMITVSALGLGLLLSASALLFNTVKIIGAIYLIWLGVSLWRGAKAATPAGPSDTSASRGTAFRAEAMVAASNPKAILIFAAFFPQFVSTEAYWQSYAMLGVSFLIMEAVAIFTYAALGRFASQFAQDRLSWMQRASGSMMCLFGVLLLFSPQPSRG